MFLLYFYVSSVQHPIQCFLLLFVCFECSTLDSLFFTLICMLQVFKIWINVFCSYLYVLSLQQPIQCFFLLFVYFECWTTQWLLLWYLCFECSTPNSCFLLILVCFECWTTHWFLALISKFWVFKTRFNVFALICMLWVFLPSSELLL